MIPDPEKGAAPNRHDQLIGLSLAEIRHLFTRIETRAEHVLFVIGWSISRRRHQQRARACHYARRGQLPP